MSPPGFKILIFVDEGQPGEWAVGLGSELARALDAAVILLTTDDTKRRNPQLLESTVRRIAEDTGREPTCRVRSGSAREAIVAESYEISPALTVFPPAGRRGLARVFKGSRVKKVVHRSPSTMVVARQPASDRIRRVLVPVSGGPMSETTLLSAHEVARALRAQLAVLHVQSAVTLPTPTDAERSTSETSRQATAGDRESGRANAPTIPDVTPMIERLDWSATGEPKLLFRRGMVVREILDECRSGSYDLLVLGQHLAVKEAGGPLSANIAEHLALECPLPVLIVRPRRWAAGARRREEE